MGRASPGLALVIAAPGSGKTTLLAQAAHHGSAPTAWFCAGPEDGAEQALVRHLAQAMVTAGERLERPMDSVDALLEATEAIHHPALLVVDDLHALAGTPAEAGLERFLWLRPRHLRVLLGSRRPPSMNTPRLQASGELVELGGDDLRFRSWEVEDLFRRVHGEPLSPECAAALTRRTGGWAAALQLFHLATMGRSRHEREAAVRELTGRSRLLRSYLARNVLAELPVDRRDFLLHTCTMGVLTGSMCDELLDRSGSGAVLADLERQQFFTTSNDDCASFRYHQVLRSHLEVLLVDELGEASARHWYARSAHVLEKAGYHQEALHAFARSEDWGAVARLIRQGQPFVDAQSEGGTALMRTGSANDDPWLRLAEARRLLRCGSLGRAVAVFREAEALVDDPEFRSRCVAERALAALWLPLGTADLARYPTGVVGAPQLARQTASLVRTATMRAVDLSEWDAPPDFAAGMALLLAGRMDRATVTLERAAVSAQAPWEQRCARLATIVGDLIGGGSRDWSRVLEDLGLSADVDGEPWLARLARATQAAVLAVGTDEPSWAESCAELERACRSEDDLWGALLIALVLGDALSRTGRDEAALRTLARAQASAHDLNAPVLGVWAEVVALRSIARLHPADLRSAGDLARKHAHAVGIEVAPALACLLDPVAARPSPAEPALLRTAAGEKGYDSSATTLTCLGGFRLCRGGDDVDPSSLRPRARELLFLLALHHGRDLHREVIIDTLWPEAPPEAGTHRFHVAASSVRRFLTTNGCGEQPLLRHGDTYRLDLGCGRSDVELFELRLREAARLRLHSDAATVAEAWTRGVEAYTGDLLPEAGPVEWVVPHRERLRVAAASAAVEAARGAGRLGRFAHAIAMAQCAVELDPLRDTTWALLAELQHSAGDSSAAVATRRRHGVIASTLAGRTVVPPARAVSRSRPTGPDA